MTTLCVELSRDATGIAANHPASTACFIASAIRTGSRAPATPVFISTASAPSSIARAASEAVPTPASTTTGTFACSTMMRRFAGFRMPSPDPIGAPSGMTAARPELFELAAHHRVVDAVGQNDETLIDQDLRRLEQLFVVGEEGLLVSDHLQLHPVPTAQLTCQTSRTNGIVGGVTTSRIGQQQITILIDGVDQVFVALGIEVDAPQSDRDDLGTGDFERRLHDRSIGVLAGSEQQPGVEGLARYFERCNRGGVSGRRWILRHGKKGQAVLLLGGQAERTGT